MTAHATSTPDQSLLPPVTQLVVGAVASTVIAGIIVAAQVPNTDTLWPAFVLFAVAVVLLAVAIVWLARVPLFAWETFFRVGGWALVGYAVIAGMLEFVFIHDGMRGSVLTIFTLLLVAYAVAVPLLFAFSAARYQEPKRRESFVPMDDR